MSWVLLIFLIAPDGATSEVLAYPSEAACETAAAEVRAKDFGRWVRVSALCLEAGDMA